MFLHKILKIELLYLINQIFMVPEAQKLGLYLRVGIR